MKKPPQAGLRLVESGFLALHGRNDHPIVNGVVSSSSSRLTVQYDAKANLFRISTPYRC